MKIYELKTLTGLKWMQVFHMVVIADNEAEARTLASEECWEEGPNHWLDKEFSTCKELIPDEKGVVVKDGVGE